MSNFSERVFSAGSHDSIHLTGIPDPQVDYLDGPIVELKEGQ